LTLRDGVPILLGVNVTREEADTKQPRTASSAECHGVPAEAWKHLCDSAALLRRLAPWAWMEPTRCFGIGIPGTDQVAFINLMGAGGKGQNHACFAFLGWEAFVHIRDLMETKTLAIRDLLETPALQLTFVPFDQLSAEDQAILACAGMSEPAAEPAPVFRSHRTGFLPWLLAAEEVGQLTTLLRQTAGVVMRCENQPDLLKPPKPGVVWILGQDAAGHWQEAWHPIPPPAAFARPLELDADKLARVAALPCGPARVQFDLALSRATVGQKGNRLRTTYLLAAFDSESGTCIGADVVLPVDGLEAMWRSVPDRFLNLCLHASSLPREIEVGSEQMMATLRPLLGHLPVKLTLRLRLPHFQAFLESMNTLKTSREPETT
jgi:hypothetical protein